MNVEAFPVVAKEGDRKVIGVVEQRDLLRTLHVESGKANRAGR
jgi:CBS domain-containing protein